MRDQSLLDNIRIASPCHARWEDMTGDDRARFCGQCSKHVYNFASMTRAEVESLIREKEGRICGRIYRRRDGRVLTADCEVGVQRKRNRIKQVCGVLASFMMFLLGGCSRRPPETMGRIAQPQMGTPLTGDVYVPATTNSPRALMGEMMISNAPPQTIQK